MYQVGGLKRCSIQKLNPIGLQLSIEKVKSNHGVDQENSPFYKAKLMTLRGYDFFDHTADIGIRAQGATLEELFVYMVQGLVELIAEDSVLKPQQARSLQLSADEVESLLLTWMQEVLFWFSTERFLPVTFTLDEVTPTSLRGTVRGDTFDPACHVQGREVKAITRHLLEVSQRNGQWYGQVIVDI